MLGGISVWFWPLLVGVPLAGVVLCLLGWRGRLVDSRPYCRGCRFCVEGVGSATCPECGRDLGRKRAVRTGRRVRRRAMLLPGALLLLVTVVGVGAAVWGAATSFNYNTIKPVWMLEMESSSAHAATSAGSWRELAERVGDDRLAAGTVDRLVDAALNMQRAPMHPWSPEIGDFVEAARAKGMLDDERWFAYYREGISLAVVTRSLVAPGSPVPTELRVSSGRLSSRSSLFLGIGTLRLRDRDGDVITQRECGSRMGLSSGGSGTTRLAIQTGLPAGVFEGVLDVSLSLREGFAGTEAHAWQSPFPVKFELAPGGAVAVEPAPDAATDRQLVKAFGVGRLHVEQVENSLTTLYLELRVDAIPMACSFDIIAVVDGREVVAGEMALPASGGHSAYGLPLRIHGFAADELTLILRTNPEHAADTVDITSVWDGEIVLGPSQVTGVKTIGRPAGVTDTSPAGTP